GDTVHHRLGHQIVGAGPDIDDLVVLFALGYQTRGELGFALHHLVFVAGDNVDFGSGNVQVVNANGFARLGREIKTGVHQLISKDDCCLKTDQAVALVDNPGNGLFGHRLVNQIEAQTFWNDFPEQGTTNGGVLNADVFNAL